MILELLYFLFIHPIVFGMHYFMGVIYSWVSSYGLAIILLSLVVNILLIPVFRLSEKWAEQERLAQESMANKLKEIKKVFKGQERFMMISRLYKVHHYHPVLAIRNSVGLLIQIPFFFAAYLAITHYDVLVGEKFLIFDDLSQPDGLIMLANWSINVMPIVMTLISLVSIHVYTKNASSKERAKAWILPGLFLVFLYSMPVALVLYWTMNNIFSLVKSLLVDSKLVNSIMRFSKKSVKNTHKYDGLIRDTSLIFLGALIIFLFVPLAMIGNNPSEFEFLEPIIFFKTTILFTLIVGVVLSFVNLLLRFFSLKKTGEFCIIFFLSHVILSGFIFPVSESEILVNPKDLSVDVINVILVISLSTIISLMGLKGRKKPVYIFLGVTLVVSVISSVFAISKSDSIDFTKHIEDLETRSYSDDSLKLSKNKNILVISFDGLSGSMITSLIKNNQSFSNSLKDFKIFSKATNSFPSTDDSLTSDIYGIQDYQSIGDSGPEIKEKLNRSELFRNSIGSVIDDTFQYGYRGFGLNSIENNTIELTFNFFEYVVPRVAPPYVLKVVPWEKSRIFHKYIGIGVGLNETSSLTKIFQEMKEKNIHNWFKGPVDFEFFNKYISRISLSDEKVSLRYIHMLFTHAPVLYSEDCNYKGGDKVWFDKNQNEMGLKNQSVCGLKMFIMLLKKLKQLEIYENSLIIFKSDHGARHMFFNEYPDNTSINGSVWGYNRYNSTLMVKDFHQKNSRPLYEDKLVLQGDIPKTICFRASIGKNCNVFNGVDLLSELSEFDEPYYLYVPKEGAKNFWLHENTISVRIPSRNISLLQAMEQAEKIKLSPRTQKD